MSENRQKLPLFMQGTEANLKQVISDDGIYSDIDRAAYVFLTDCEQLAYVDSDRTIHKIVGNNKRQVSKVDTLPNIEYADDESLYIFDGTIYVYDSEYECYEPLYKDITSRVGLLESKITNIGKDISNIRDKLANLPITELIGTMSDPICVSNLEDGFYCLKGQYTISPSLSTIFIAGSQILFLISHEDGLKTVNVRRITSNAITDYTVYDDTIITDHVLMESFLSECDYVTNECLDKKILALVESIKVDNSLTLEDIDSRIDAKIISATSEDIQGLFKN